jgi:hypothetical protein
MTSLRLEPTTFRLVSTTLTRAPTYIPIYTQMHCKYMEIVSLIILLQLGNYRCSMTDVTAMQPWTLWSRIRQWHNLYATCQDCSTNTDLLLTFYTASLPAREKDTALKGRKDTCNKRTVSVRRAIVILCWEVLGTADVKLLQITEESERGIAKLGEIIWWSKSHELSGRLTLSWNLSS